MKDVFDKKSFLPVNQALEILLRQPYRMVDTERVRIEEAYQRVLAEDILSPEDLPGFNRSTMDGYAVYAEDTYGASDTAPAYLNVVGEITMGEAPDIVLSRGEAAQIPTGGMLPKGANAVVMFEHTNRVDETLLEVYRPVARGENIIRADEDIKKGELVLKTGHLLRPQDIGALAGLGITEIEVYKRPIVAIISTGDEIVPASSPIAPGKVRDINSFNLDGLLRQNGAIAKKMGIINDDLDLLRKVLKEAFTLADMVLITGGSSVGVRDYTSRLIDELGNPGILFHGVAIKPGKPIIAALADGKPIFGLPGHPAAVTVSFESFVKPVLKLISGHKDPNHKRQPLIRAVLTRNLSSSTGREDHVRVKLVEENGTLKAVPVLGKSGLIKTLVEADGLIVIPRDCNGLYEGQEVEVIPFQ